MDKSDKIEQIYLIVGRIEGRMDNMGDLPKRVAALEQWQFWLKGGLTTLASGFAYLQAAAAHD